MWFKNVRCYRLNEKLSGFAESLEEALSDYGFQPCGSFDSRRIGWVPPLSQNGGGLVHAAAGCLMIAAREQEKLLPPSVLREQLEEQVRELQHKEGREVGRREKRRLKDNLLDSLLPQALTRSRLTYAFIAPEHEMLLIDSATARRAEDLLDLMRDSLGNLAVRPLQPRSDPSEKMTRWLASGKPPRGFEFGGDCNLRDPLDTANQVRCRAQELASQEVRNHLDAGKRCQMLGLVWENRIGFQLADDFSVRRLKFTEFVIDQAALEVADEAAQFDSDFAIQSVELLALFEALIKLFGEAGIE